MRPLVINVIHSPLRACTLAAVLAGVLTVTGCGWSQTTSPAAQTASDQPTIGAFASTSPREAIKSASLEDADRFYYGADYAAELDNHKASSSATDLLLMPTWADGSANLDDLAYVLFVFSLAGYTDLPQLNMRWQNPQPSASACFIGIGNLDRDCWEWHNTPPTEELQLAGMAPYIDAEGRAVVAVAVAGQGLYTLSWLRWGGNIAPVADLQADPPSGAPPLTVDFSASACCDLDGSIADFEWDLDGDAEFNESGPEADARGSDAASYTYMEEGNYSPAVRVTDDGGAQRTGTAEVTSALIHGWVVVLLESCPGALPSLAVVDGCPAISYLDTSGEKLLKYVRASTATGSNAADWSSPVSIDSTDYFSCTSLAVVDGDPAVAYCRLSESEEFYELRYARSTSSTGLDAADWSQLVTVDSSADGQFGPTLAEVSGNPAIACYYYEGTHVVYTRSTTSTGASASDWDTKVTIATANDSAGPSLAIVDGHPAISYHSYPVTGLKYVRALTSTGDAALDWSQIVSLGEWLNQICPSLAVVEGNPAICYVNRRVPADDDELVYLRATTSTGADASDWSQKVTVDTCSSRLQGTSLLVASGSPLTGYWASGNRDLMYAHASTSTGSQASDWNEVATIDPEAASAPAAALVNGSPAFCYVDNVSHVLKYAYYVP